jgi:nicotinate-nucleotide--dimethylbenzimidazole phosphoribosyltransferase
MTETGQVPGDGLPGSAGEEAVPQPQHADRSGTGAGAAQQPMEPMGPEWGAAEPMAPAGVPLGVPGQSEPAVPASTVYTFMDHSAEAEVLDEDDDLLLMPGPQGTWGDPQPVPSQPSAPPTTSPAAAPEPEPQADFQPAAQQQPLPSHQSVHLHQPEQSPQQGAPQDPQAEPGAPQPPQAGPRSAQGPRQSGPAVAASQDVPGLAPIAGQGTQENHETGSRDSGSTDLGAAPVPQVPGETTATRPTGPAASAVPAQAAPAATDTEVPRRPLHMGPPIPDPPTGGLVRSLADRGPATSPTPTQAFAPAPPAPEPAAAEVPGQHAPTEPQQQPQQGPVAAVPAEAAQVAASHTPAPEPQTGSRPEPGPGPTPGPEPEPQAHSEPEPESQPVPQPAAEATDVPAQPRQPPAEPTVPQPEAAAETEEQAAGASPHPQARPESVAETTPEPVAEAQAPIEQPGAAEAVETGEVAPAPPVEQARTPGAESEPRHQAVGAGAAASAEGERETAEGPESRAATSAATVAEPEATPEPEPTAEPEATPEAQPAAEAEPNPEAQPAAEAEPGVQAEPESEPATGTAAETDTEAGAETEPETRAETGTQTDPDPHPGAESGTGAPAESHEEAPGETHQGTPDAARQEAPGREAHETARPEAPAKAHEGAAEEAGQEATGDVGGAEGAQRELPAEPVLPAAEGYDDAVREAVHRVIRERRDIRNGFRRDPIPHEVLIRVLEAAHTAPSVGHSQPWDFVVIRSAETREKMHELAMRQREAYAKSLPKGRAKQFRELKIEAILDTPVNIVVTADPTRGGRHTLGRYTQPQMAPYSSALAVENLWLAARAEGLGVGWVSFFDEREMVRELGLPEHLEAVAYLCVGYVDEFPEDPELVQAGWSRRRPLSWVVHEESYGNRVLPGSEEPSDLLGETLRGIRPLDAKALGEAWERQKRMTKPAGALGMLEIISAQLSGLSRQCPPPIPEPAAVAIFAGDHGVHAQGVTAWPQEVTGQMVANFLAGGAVCNAFAAQVGAEVCVVDVGVSAELTATPGLLPRKVRPGTDDMTAGPAMSRADALRAIEVGIETARDLVAAGNRALLTGEMGVANTTVSAALISVFTGVDPVEVTGRGTGITDEMHTRKIDVVRRALELHEPDPSDPISVLTAIGGLEHAAMVGLLLGAASLRTPVILDGVSAGAAALVARAIAPEVLAACIAGHRSAEPGHVAALTKLGLRPLVDLDLRLGEGTGALLALPLVQSAARAMQEVATFDAAGVTEKS